MNSSVLMTSAIVLAVLVLVVYRQLTPHAMRDNPLKLPMILGAIGAYESYGYLSAHPTVPVGDVAGVLVGLTLATLIAYPRAQSVSIYRAPDGTWMSRGNIRTLGWWVVAVIAHGAAAIGIPALCGEHVHGLSGLESSTMMIYLALSLGVQFWLMHQRRQSAELVKKGTSTRPGATLTHI